MLFNGGELQGKFFPEPRVATLGWDWGMLSYPYLTDTFVVLFFFKHNIFVTA